MSDLFIFLSFLIYKEASADNFVRLNIKKKATTRGIKKKIRTNSHQMNFSLFLSLFVASASGFSDPWMSLNLNRFNMRGEYLYKAMEDCKFQVVKS